MPIIIPLTSASPGPTTAYTSALQDIMPQCSGLSMDYASYAIRKAAIDFCSRTWWLQTTLTGTMVDTTATYTLAPPAQTELIGLVWAKNQRDLTGAEVECPLTTPAEIAMLLQSGAPYRFTRPTVNEITFFPTPDGAYTYSVRMALRPTMDSTVADSSLLAQKREALTHGALMSLFAMPNKPWSAPALVSYHSGEFMRHIREAKIELNRALTGFSPMVDLSGARNR